MRSTLSSSSGRASRTSGLANAVGDGFRRRVPGLKPLEYFRALRLVLGVAQHTALVQLLEHVHLLEDGHEGRHRPPREVGIRGDTLVFSSPTVELAQVEERLDRREGDPVAVLLAALFW